MTEKLVKEIRKKISTKVGSTLYKVFFEGRQFRPKEGLFHNEQILDEIGIPWKSPIVNSLEHDGIMRLLGGALAILRKGARNRKQPWLDIYIEDFDRKVVFHGFTDDINKAMDCIKRYKEIADKYRKIARITEHNLKQKYPQIENKKTA